MSQSSDSPELVDAEFAEPPLTALDCMRSFQFISENPKWLQNVLFVAVCAMLPVIGPLLIMGYQFEMAESLLHGTKRGGYVDFDFDRFTKYLVRGLWPFLVSLIVGMVMVIPMIMMWMAMVMLMVLAEKSGAGGPLIAIGMMFLFLLLFVLSIALNVVMIPFQLRAGYSQDIAKAFDIGFAKEFLGLMWKEILVGMFFLILCSIPLMLIGMALCFVGVYATTSILMLAQGHLIDYQLYAIYLSRGGTPIPEKREDVAVSVE